MDRQLYGPRGRASGADFHAMCGRKRRELVPQLFPSGPFGAPTKQLKGVALQGFPRIGETGFEPATARPPAREVG